MKALILLEYHFFIDKDDVVWCDRVIDYSFLQRYLDVFDKIVVVGRTVYEKEGFTKDRFKLKVSGKNVEFKPLPEYIGIKGVIKNHMKVNKLLNDYLNDVEIVICRAPTPVSLFTYKTIKKNKKVLGVEFMFDANKMIEGNGFISKIANIYISHRAKKICNIANGVAYVTEKHLQKLFPCKALIGEENELYFSTNYSTVEIKKDNFSVKQWKENEKPSVFNIIHIGFMDNYRKGQHVLIQAFKKVVNSGINVKLTFIGDGLKRKEFEKIVIDNDLNNYVEFLGLITDRKVIFEELRKSHLFVFPTEAEGLPRTIIEAMAVGLPCIASPVDGIPELIDEDYLVECNDVDGYANKIIELLNNWNKMISLSKRNYNEALKYEKDILDKKRKSFYKKLVNAAKQ